MVNRSNYFLVKEHLNYLDEVEQLSKASVERGWYGLRHLLLWADEMLFRDVRSLRPTFPTYVASQPGRKSATLSAAAMKKIIGAAKRFFKWAKLNYPDRFKGFAGIVY